MKNIFNAILVPWQLELEKQYSSSNLKKDISSSRVLNLQIKSP